MFKKLSKEKHSIQLPVNVFFLAGILWINISVAQVPAALGWYEIPNTKLRSVCPPNGFGGSGYNFTDKCWGLTGAWSSAVFDPGRNHLVVWGGGHADYYGNEIYTLDLSNLTISRLNDPGLPLVNQGSGCSGSQANGNEPSSRHSVVV